MAVDKGDGNVRVEAAANSAGGCERFAVEGALVVCTQMFEGQSSSIMTPSSGIMVNGANELIHTDVEFEPKFEKCRYDYEDCEPDIEGGEWHDYSDGNQSNGGFGILEERSFMVCLKGYGLLYISEDGQRPSEAKRLFAKLLIKLGDRRLLGLFMLAAFSRDPVNLATGNFIFIKTDLEIYGKVPIKFRRFYNAMDDYVGSLGRGWYHPYDIKLRLEEESVIIRFEDGHEEIYTVGDEASKSFEEEILTKDYRLCKQGGKLSNPDEKKYNTVDSSNQLIKSEDMYRLVKSDGTSLYFDKEGKITKIENQDKLETILTYDEDKLINVATLGINLTLAYEGGKLKILKDHTSRTVIYTYDEDLLRSVTDPLGNTCVYNYDEKGRFLSERNPEGNLMVQNSYDEENRTISQVFSDGGEMRYEYDDEERRTKLIAQNGSETVYYRDDLYRTTRIEYPDGGEEVFEFNEENQKISETDQIGNRTYYDFDENGKIASIKKPLDKMMNFSYNANGQIESVKVNGLLKLYAEYDSAKNIVLSEDGLKRQIKYAYGKHKRGLPTKITQPDGSEINLKYDEQYNLTSVRDPFGATIHYEYDTFNRVTRVTDGNGNKTLLDYDLNNNLTSVTNAQGQSRTYRYNKANSVIEIIDFNGGKTRIDYNSLNKPSAITDPLGRTTKLFHDKMWNVNKVIQPNGLEMGFVYDENNRIVQVENPDSSIIEYDYDQNGNRTRVVIKARSALNNKIDEQESPEEDKVTYLKYDQLHRLIEVSTDEGVQVFYKYNATGQIVAITDAMGKKINMTYDEVGQLVQETDVLGNSRFYTYTSLGNIETVIDEAGRLTKYGYEQGGRLKSIHHPVGTVEYFTYDNNGNIRTHTNETGQKTTMIYDSLNRVTEVIRENGGIKKYTYDTVGNIASISDELENITAYEYSLSGKITKVIDSIGNETHYSYDVLDQLIEMKQLGGNGVVNDTDLNIIEGRVTDEIVRTITYKRNILGQVESVTDALGNTERYWYTLTGQIAKKLDKDGYLTKYNYTNQGNVNQIEYDDGRQIFMSYNPSGQLVEVDDWLGKTSIEVDSFGRATKITNHRGEVVKYTYGKGNERRSITYPDGKVINYHYDQVLRLSQVQDGEQYTNYIYDDYSRLIEKQYPNGVITKYGFNEINQLESLTHSKTGKDYREKDYVETTDQFYYRYDILGNKIEIKKFRNGRGAESTTGRFEYQFDKLNRLTKVMQEHDTLRSYKYDAFGNRTKMFEKDKSTSYTYNALNQLIVSHDNQGNTNEYLYDGRGNLSKTYKDKELTHQYHFGALNRLESVFNYGQNKGAVYSYNGLGHRVGKMAGLSQDTVTESTEMYDIMLNTETYSNDVIDFTRRYHNLLQRNGGEVIYNMQNEYEFKEEHTYFVYDFGVLSANTGDSMLNYLHDDLGSPIRLLDERGNEREILDYNEFGDSLLPACRKQPFSFTGYQKDDISDTLFAQARHYDSKTGRFVSEDLIKGFIHAPDTLNQYTYCWNRPLNLVDLDGQCPICSPLPPHIHGPPSPICDFCYNFVGPRLPPDWKPPGSVGQVPLPPSGNIPSHWKRPGFTGPGPPPPPVSRPPGQPAIPPTIIGRESWNPIPGYVHQVDTTERFSIVVHHTYPGTGNQNIQNIDRAHREWTSGGLAYHFLIRYDGAIIEGRPLNALGCHANPNSGRLGIGIMGSFLPGEGLATELLERPTTEQLESLQWLINYLKNIFPSIDIVEPHHEMCPGGWFDPNDFK